MAAAVAELITKTPEKNQQTYALSTGAGNVVAASGLELELGYESLPYAELVPEGLWQRLTARIEKDEGVDSQMAQKMMNESLGFLKACGDNPGVALSPSEKVDVGWHTFILYTSDYADFCDNVVGGFIHHEPNDGPALISEGDEMTVKDTLNFLQSNGYETDEELWVDVAADGRCSSHCRNT